MKNPKTCEIDFYLKLVDTLTKAGGQASSSYITELANKPFWEVIEILAPNGIRLQFNPSWSLTERKEEPSSKKLFEKANKLMSDVQSGRRNPRTVVHKDGAHFWIERFD